MCFYYNFNNSSITNSAGVGFSPVCSWITRLQLGVCFHRATLTPYPWGRSKSTLLSLFTLKPPLKITVLTYFSYKYFFSTTILNLSYFIPKSNPPLILRVPRGLPLFLKIYYSETIRSKNLKLNTSILFTTHYF